MTIETIKSILSELTYQLKDGAITNQNIICRGYIPLKAYDSGSVTHFALIRNKKSKKIFPDSVVEINLRTSWR